MNHSRDEPRVIPRNNIDIPLEYLSQEELYLREKAILKEKDSISKLLMAHEVVTYEGTSRNSSPICGELRAACARSNKSVPTTGLPRYDGEGCPAAHQAHYESKTAAAGLNEDVQAILFCSTLHGKAMEWYLELKPNSIISYRQLMTQFKSHFSNFKKKKKPYSTLAGIVQRKDETFRQYIHRFNTALLSVEDPPFTTKMDYLYSNTLTRRFAKELAYNMPQNAKELEKMIERHKEGDDLRRDIPIRAKIKEEGQKREGKEKVSKFQHRRERQRTPPRRYQHFTELKRSRTEILTTLQGKTYVTWPRKRREHPNVHDSGLYCRFHRQYGHTTDECEDLIGKIERLIDLGYLKDFITKKEMPQQATYGNDTWG